MNRREIIDEETGLVILRGWKETIFPFLKPLRPQYCVLWQIGVKGSLNINILTNELFPLESYSSFTRWGFWTFFFNNIIHVKINHILHYMVYILHGSLYEIKFYHDLCLRIWSQPLWIWPIESKLPTYTHMLETWPKDPRHRHGH